MYRYVTSANYFGEIVEWAGWAILTCSLSGLVSSFGGRLLTLFPRANAIWHRYREEFGDAGGKYGNECSLSCIKGAFYHDLRMT